MISPEMTFRQGFSLPFDNLDNARAFGESVFSSINQAISEHFSSDLFQTSSETLSEGSYSFNLSNDSFEANINLIIGWDQTNINGVISKFLALNITADGFNRGFRNRLPLINSLPDKGYYTGTISGGLFGFILSMAYSYETDDINLLMFMIVMIAFGWVGLKLGTFVGNKLLDSTYDKAHESAMTDTLFLSSSGPWLSFLDQLPQLIENQITNEPNA
ncbi:MAG: hypothetical protein NE330_19925 [Lentisphaeraceae bacterium]|nr:hypothetical protein [Lentisphaeraceae bacterium]